MRSVRAFRALAQRDKTLYIRMKSALTECQPEVGPKVAPRV
nr:MAG TPA: hypothetical protein [Caudoviricetes sp.]